jgi:hypothetical protein
MIAVLAGLALAAVLGASALAKLADRRGARLALATYGIRDGRLALAALIAVELALAAGLALGVALAAPAAAGLFALFALAQAWALARGRAGAPCACFGARGRVSRVSLARAALLAGACALLPALERRALSTEEWLAVGLGVALAGMVATGVVVAALAREVGMLRLAVGYTGALEIPHEGPQVGVYSPLLDWFDALAPDQLALAVFASQGCSLCRSLAPAVEAFGRDPRVALRIFDEEADRDAWTAAAVPGSPFAVTLDADGTVLSKGTFNTGAQLESVLAAAERRRAGARA